MRKFERRGSMRGVWSLVALSLCACDALPPPSTAVSKAQFEAAGMAWPLSVDRGRVTCSGTAHMFEPEGGHEVHLGGGPCYDCQTIHGIMTSPEADLGDLQRMAKKTCRHWPTPFG